jgi:regulatory protein
VTAAPRVTALVAEPPGRVRVELDGAPWRTLPTAAVVAAGLAVGTALDRPRARTLRRELRKTAALAVGTAALARREHSAAELAAKLERRGIVRRDREQVLGALERAGYVDDARFAATRANSLAARGYGDDAIRVDLKRHRIPAAALEAALAALPGEDERAAELVRVLGRTPRAARRLVARGFAHDAIDAALGEPEFLRDD